MSTPEQHDDHVSTLYLYEDWYKELGRTDDMELFPSWEDVVWSCTQIDHHITYEYSYNEFVRKNGCTCTKDLEMFGHFIEKPYTCEYCLRKEKGWF